MAGQINLEKNYQESLKMPPDVTCDAPGAVTMGDVELVENDDKAGEGLQPGIQPEPVCIINGQPVYENTTDEEVAKMRGS